jgi:response regulator RpfG family c-di-GMP phosphodiesterase
MPAEPPALLIVGLNDDPDLDAQLEALGYLVRRAIGADEVLADAASANPAVATIVEFSGSQIGAWELVRHVRARHPERRFVAVLTDVKTIPRVERLANESGAESIVRRPITAAAIAEKLV